MQHCVTKLGKARDPTGQLMDHYRAAKQSHPGMFLLLRLGAFYELYGEDAQAAAKDLGLGLTQRTDRDTGEVIHMASFPYQALEGYLRRLLGLGHRLAICDWEQDILPEEAATNTPPTLFDDVED